MKPSSKCKGIGTLIAATFILLILVTAFVTITLYNRAIENYQLTVKESIQLNAERNLEEFEITDVFQNSTGTYVKIKNTGSVPIVISYIGVLNNTYRRYFKVNDVYINPGEEETIGIGSIGLSEALIQAVSERGNLASYSYPSQKLSDLEILHVERYNYTLTYIPFLITTLYAHQEQVSIATGNYYTLKTFSADASGIALVATYRGWRPTYKLLGKFVYSLQGISRLPAGNWTFYYRGFKEGFFNAYFCVDILIRSSDGSIRHVIDSKVARSRNSVSTTNSTLIGSYNFPGYTVTSGTDYLEIDYYAYFPFSPFRTTVYLIIDDSSLSICDQTRLSSSTYIFQALVSNVTSMETLHDIKITFKNNEGVPVNITYNGITIRFYEDDNGTLGSDITSYFKDVTSKRFTWFKLDPGEEACITYTFKYDGTYVGWVDVKVTMNVSAVEYTRTFSYQKTMKLFYVP